MEYERTGGIETDIAFTYLDWPLTPLAVSRPVWSGSHTF